MSDIQGAVSGVVLAAGRSSRLGRPKQLLPIGDRPLLTHVLRHAAASNLAEVVLVLGHHADVISKAVGEWGQRLVVNDEYAAGQSTSLRAGLAAVSPDAAAVLFLLGDQPQILPRTIDTLIAAFQGGNTPIVIPSYEGTEGHPVLISRALFQELHDVTGDQGAREVIRAHAAAVLRVPVAGPPPGDVDTEEDYAALVARWPAVEGLASEKSCSSEIIAAADLDG